MIVAPNDVEIEVGQEAFVNLAAYDADHDAIRTELIYRHALARAYCRNCF
jgi:hypothetical protein